MAEPVEVPTPVVNSPEPVGIPDYPSDQPYVPPEIAQGRANKADLGGVGSLVGKTSSEMLAAIESGHEKDLRDLAAASYNVEQMKDKQKRIAELSKIYGPLSSEQVSHLLDPFNPINQQADPETIMEKMYAKSFVGTLATSPLAVSSENIMDIARREIPKQASDIENTANDLTVKNQLLQTELENAKQLNSQQSWLGWGVDQLKSFSQLYPELKERGLVDNIYGEGLLGTNLDEQSNALYRKSIPDFKNTLSNIKEKLKSNPSLYVSYLESLVGQDQFEKNLNNVFTAMAIPDLALGAKVVKKVMTFNQTAKAARDIVSASAKADPTPAKMVAAAGDLHQSGLMTVTDGVIKAVQGVADPLKSANETLMTSWKSVAEEFANNPGTYLSREVQTRMLDDIAKDGQNFINRIQTMSRVERNPQALSPEIVKAQIEHIKQTYRGPNAMVIDADGPFIEPFSNTKWYRVHLGDHDGSLFTDSATAGGRAEQVGLTTIEGKEPGKVYIPEVAAKHLESVETREGSAKFFVDKGIEVQSSPTPRPGFVPYNLKTNKFEPTLTEATAHIEQQGVGFRIVHWLPMRETSDMLRDTMIKDLKGAFIPETISSSSARGTKSIVNSVLGWVRNSEDTLSLQENAQRKAAVYSQSNIHRLAYDLNKSIEQVKNKGSWWKPTAYLGKVSGKEVVSQFERALDYARQTEKWFKGPGEMQDFYLRNYHRDPSPLETKAYFNYVKLIEMDRQLGEMSEFRNRARVGAEQHRIKLIGPDGKPIYSDLFDGVTLKRLPSNADQVYITGDKPEEGSVKEIGQFDSKTKTKINEELNAGTLKLVEVYDIDQHPLTNFHPLVENQRIRYVLTKNTESQPISYNHVNKKEGGHFDRDYDKYLKIADMREQKSGKHVYVGDITIMPVAGRAHGNNVAKIWNEARVLLRDGDLEAAKPLVAKMGIKWEEFTKWYKGETATERPKLNLNEPVQVVEKGKNILSIDDSLKERYTFKDQYGNRVNRFEDGSRTGFANNFKVAYNTERRTDFNFRTINDIGTKENPVYAYQPAKLIDPLPTMNRALNRAISSAFMDDYKIYAVEHWLREAEKYLDVEGGRAAIRSAPFWHYNNPKFVSSIPVDVKWNLLSNKYKIDSFVGIPSKFDTWVHTFTEHLADVAYDAYGPVEGRTFFQKARTITPIWMLHHVTNPVDFIRGVTFNFKLGLFSPAQFLVQAQTHALIWALEPQHGTVGTYAMLLHGWSKVNRNPAILNSLDDYATKLSGFGSRFKPGEWLEAQKELDNTGFEHVAGEYANVSKAYMPTTNFIQSDIEKGLKLGQTPFRLGEQSTRITAWYTAFRKFREENPTAVIGNVERNKILNYADLLTVNMSRASTSKINHGALSLTTQFLTYQIKLAELFWSKRIGETPTDRMLARARILTGFSLLYGLPNAIGVTGAPASGMAREHLIDDLGYIPGEHWWSTMLHEGLPAWQLAMITGKVDNVGARFGSQGWETVNQALRSDIPWYMALGGASATTMGNFLTSAVDPYWQGVLAWAGGNTGESKFTIKGADLVEPLREASVVSSGAKFWAAYNSGKWMNKNEGWVTDVTPLRAAWLALSGMNPQEQDDMFHKNQIIKGEEELQKRTQKEFTKDWLRMIEGFKNQDPEQANDYMRNGMSRLTVAGYPYEEILKAMAIASRGAYESGVQSSDFSYWTRGDQRKRQERQSYVQRENKLNEKQ